MENQYSFIYIVQLAVSGKNDDIIVMIDFILNQPANNVLANKNKNSKI